MNTKSKYLIGYGIAGLTALVAGVWAFSKPAANATTPGAAGSAAANNAPPPGSYTPSTVGAPHNQAMTVGQTLLVNGNPTLTNGNTSVATVAGNTITAKGTGTTTVSIQWTDATGNAYNDQLVITVA
jgi:hypothetical protein